LKNSLILAVTAAVVAGILFVLVFLPVYSYELTEEHSIPILEDIDSIKLILDADVATVDVGFQKLEDESFKIRVTAEVRSGILAPKEVYDLSFDHQVEDSTLTVSSSLVTRKFQWPLCPEINTSVTVVIDVALNAEIEITDHVGKVFMKAGGGVAVKSLDIEVDVGTVEVAFEETSTIEGDVSLKTKTGDIGFKWDNAAAGDIDVLLRAMVGEVRADIRQTDPTVEDVELRAEASTGDVRLRIAVEDDVGAQVETSTGVGDIVISQQTGFTGLKTLLKSTNYPAKSNFQINLETGVGGIEINAKYTP